MPSPGLVIGTTVRSAGSAGQGFSPIELIGGVPPCWLGHRARFGAGAAEVVPGDDGLHARVPLRDVGDAGGAVGVAGEPDLGLRVQQLPERVVGGVEPGGDAFVLLGRVAGARFAARHRLVGVLGSGEEEVDRVLGAVVERTPVGLRRHALVFVGRLAERVALTLSLWVEGQHHVAVLGERLGGVPVHLFVGLHRAVGDHDPGPRASGPAFVAHTRPDSVAPSRAVNSTFWTSP